MSKAKLRRKRLPMTGVLLAHEMAKTYLRIGATEYNGFAGPVRPGESAGGLVGLTRGAAFHAIAAATTLAFSIELFLKVAACQQKGSHLEDHDLRALFLDLSEVTRTAIAEAYEERRAARSPNALRIELLLNSKDHLAGNAGAEPFEEALDAVAQLFVQARYLHENFDSGFTRAIDFNHLLRIAECVSNAIDAHAGSIRVAWGSSP